MCGRIFCKQTPALLNLQALLGIERYELPHLDNIAPTEILPVIRHQQEGLVISSMRWWLHPHWSREGLSQKFAMFNARLETLATSRAFKGPLQDRRALVPIAGFVEWKTEQGRKQPYYFEALEQPLAVAAVWDSWRDEVWSCATITQPASPEFAAIHNRMPLLLSGEKIHQWLDREADPKALLEQVAGSCVPMSVTPVSPEINNARHKLEPVYSGASSIISA